MSLFNKFKIGLGKSSTGLSAGFKSIFSKKKMEEEFLKDLKVLFFTAIMGVGVEKE